MLKKLLIISVLCVGLLSLSLTNASAYPGRLGGWPSWPGSVYMITEWVGISNTDLKPADAAATLRIRSFMIDKVLNPGGEDGGIGQPFIEEPIDPVVVNAGATIFDVPLKGRGRYDLPIEFTDQLLSQGIKNYCDGLPPGDPNIAFCESLPKLPNPNWSWHVIVLEMDVLIQGFTDINDRCEGDWVDYNCMERDIYDENDVFVETLYEEEVVFAVGECTFPGLGLLDPNNPNDHAAIITLIENFDWDNPDPYDCTENFHWEYKNKSRTCEDEVDDCDYDTWWGYNL